MTGGTTEREALWLDRGAEDYAVTYRLQHDLHDRRRRGETPDVMIAVEHPACLTIGSGGHSEHVLATPEELAAAGISVHRADRGGDVTYHGPGQLVLYTIVDLNGYGKDVHAHARRLEEVAIQTAAALGVRAGRRREFPGVWARGGKIAAIGVGVRQWVTMHGLSLNVCPAMEHFSLVVPCGIRDSPVASLEQILGRPARMEQAREALTHACARVFGISFRGSAGSALCP